MRMHFIFLFCTIQMIMPFTASAKAPDKFGNGGGVWLCEGPSKEIFDLMFMDVFEARREYQLNLPETKLEPRQLVQEQKKWLHNNLQFGSKIDQHIDYVEKNITWIDDIIVSIPDAANKITPHPSLCKQGEWQPVQLVNFTEDFRVLIRRELFESPLITNMERGAVYLHEGIYSYLRSEYGDTTSVRTRAIVGYLLSDKSDAEKKERILKIIDGPSLPTPEPPKDRGYVCGLRLGVGEALYVSEGQTEEAAKAKVIDECIDGERIQFPFPSPFPLYGPELECRKNKVICEPILTSEKKYTCKVTDFFEKREFVGSGRTRLEAQKEAIMVCLTSGEDENTCNSNHKLTCN